MKGNCEKLKIINFLSVADNVQTAAQISGNAVALLLL